MSARPYTKQGCRYFRQNLVVATLSSTTVEITNIREKDGHPGLREFEANFLKLLHRLTNGTKIVINTTGTSVKYTPGIVVGGTFTHECNLQRGIGYWLEALAILCPFAKKPTEITLTGVTNHPSDLGVDLFRTVTVPLLRRFGIECSLKILSRGCRPSGGGIIQFSCQAIRKVAPVEIVNLGKVRRIRGLAYSARVAPDRGNRAVHAAKGIFLKLLPDVFITSEHFAGKEAGNSPGYGITVVAESTSSDVFMAQEAISDEVALKAMGPSIKLETSTAEEVGELVAKQLLEQVAEGGCIDCNHQPLAILMMALSTEQLSTICVGKLTDTAENMEVLLEEQFGVKFTTVKRRRRVIDHSQSTDEDPMDVEAEEVSHSPIGGPLIELSPVTFISCIGCNYMNIAKRSA